ncbi:MAG: protein kinase, partial [Planctomycetia bacterium]|nr:protein kinase [Planctomycetia bacterium]
LSIINYPMGFELEKNDGHRNSAEDATLWMEEDGVSTESFYSEESVQSGNAPRIHPQAPPASISGYTFLKFLGAGAYGEVWTAVQENTGRTVAVKFFTHRNGLNRELLSQEVEKLALLFSDRTVVQLLQVGMEENPPFYVMEFLENGSLAERLTERKFPRAEAERIFEELLTALAHSHARGIVHCDLKPGNILLDKDGNPRLGDFGQSRLTNDMSPALGTFFFMAPEQASLTATPDVRWDIYALGAILHTLLLGQPPHYTPDFVEKIQSHKKLSHRLKEYRNLLETEPPLSLYRELKRRDIFLIRLLEKCLQADPEKRFQSVRELQSAWKKYQRIKVRRPLFLLGAVTPFVLMLVSAFFIFWAFNSAFHEGFRALLISTIQGDSFAAESVAKSAEYEFARRIRAVQTLANNMEFRLLVEEVTASPQWEALTRKLRDPTLKDREIAQLQEQFIALEGRRRIQEAMERILPEDFVPEDFHGVELKEATTRPTARVIAHEVQQILEVIEAETDSQASSTSTSAKKPTAIDKTTRPPGFLPGEFVGETPMPEVSRRLRANVASWFFCDAHGLSAVRIPFSTTIGKDYSPLVFPCQEECPLKRTLPQNVTVSEIYRSPVSGQWVVGISAPVFSTDASRRLLGMVSMAVGVRRFVDTICDDSQFAVLVDNRPGKYHGLILQHPLYDKLMEKGNPLPEEFMRPQYRVTQESLPNTYEKAAQYRDPLAQSPYGQEFAGRWIAQSARVHLQTDDGGDWLVIVQQSYDRTIGMVRESVGKHFFRVNAVAVVVFLVVLWLMWFWVRKSMEE